jgi:hypothetical protein
MSGCKIDRKRGVITIMFNFLFNTKKENSHMARTKLSKTAKIRNLFAKGNAVTWKSLRTTFDLRSPASMVGKLRNEGMMIYENRTSSGVSYRVGAPSKAVIAAGQTALFGNQGYSA